MGGADKHMMHPYDNLSLKFSDILSMIVGHTMGTIPVTEKLDGINLNFTLPDSSVKFARNMGDVKKGGSTLSEFDNWLGSHPGRNQFMTGAEKISEANFLWRLPTDVWVSAEVISTKFPQLLKYDKDHLVFHGISRPKSNYQNMEDVTTKFKSSYENLVSSSQSEWQILGQIPITMRDRTSESFYMHALQELSEIMRVWKMEWWNTLEDLVRAKTKERVHWWGLDEESLAKFLNMILGYGGSVVTFRKLLPVSYHTDLNSIGMHKTREAWRKSCLSDIKALWTRFGAALLAPLTSTLISDKAAQQSRLKALLYYSCSESKRLKDNGPHEMRCWESLCSYLDTYNSLKLTGPPTIEGLVFYHNQKRYKVTGAFAALNRVIGTARYDLGIKIPNI